MFKMGHKIPSNRLRFFLGNTNQHTSYEAEAIGLLLAAWTIYRERNTLKGSIAIYADNQAVIQAISNPKAKSAQYIIAEFLCLMEESSRTFDTRPAGSPTSIKIAWISAHSDIPLNKYLHRIKRKDSPNCEACLEDGIEMPETPRHLLFKCPSYDRERFLYEKNMGRKAHNLKYVMSHPSRIVKLAKYIISTDRFKRRE